MSQNVGDWLIGGPQYFGVQTGMSLRLHFFLALDSAIVIERQYFEEHSLRL
ncbi:MAG: hypothetical protein IT367_06940 [Candidatus Hydrogenedentes bacterium]|nr:hypothetical protein [Candidatus Hydrogenedentota bacterium]